MSIILSDLPIEAYQEEIRKHIYLVWIRFVENEVRIWRDGVELNPIFLFEEDILDVVDGWGNRNLIKITRKLKNGNCPNSGKLDSESEDLSLAVIDKKATRPGGLEPPTFGFEVRDSVQLSYGRINP